MAEQDSMLSEQFACRDSVQISSAQHRAQKIKERLNSICLQQQDNIVRGNRLGSTSYYPRQPKQSSDSQDVKDAMRNERAMFNSRIDMAPTKSYRSWEIPHNQVSEKSPKYPTRRYTASDTSHRRADDLFDKNIEYVTMSASHRRDEESRRASPGYGARFEDGASPGYGTRFEDGANPGYKASPEDGARPGYGARFEDGARPGYGARFEDGARPGYGACFEDGANPGYKASPEDGARFEDGASPGHKASLGYKASPGYGAILEDDMYFEDGACAGHTLQRRYRENEDDIEDIHGVQEFRTVWAGPLL